MQVSDLPLAPTFIDHFETAGITTLYPPQAATVEAGICAGENVVAAMPTASGKTFVAQLALLTADGPGLYVCPLRALAREKYESFAALPGIDVGVSTGDFDATGEELADNDIVVATSEKVDSAIRNGASWVSDLACVVVDEVHLLDASRRGPTLEVTVATLRRRAPDVQVVALSATVDNPAAIAEWLDAALVESDWRPVDLRTGVYADGEVTFPSGPPLSVPDAPTPDGEETDAAIKTAATAALVGEAIDGGGQCLAFVRSRREAAALAERLAEEGLAERFGVAEEAAAAAEEAADVDGTVTGARLADCLRAGVGFHHAGLRAGHRAVVERTFRERSLACICATPTLAAGVNVPARRVVVRDQERYTGTGMEPVPVLEVHQMCGRAGRPGLDPRGEAVLVGDTGSRAALFERYVEGEPEAVESRLADPGALRTHVLSVVATGFASTEAEILDVFEGTFYARATGAGGLADAVADAVDDLVAMGMIERDTAGGVEAYRLVATPVGETTSKQYVRPETGERIVDGLRTAVAMERPSTLTVLEVVCDTPDMDDTYLGNRERADIYRFASTHASEFTTGMGDVDDFEGWLESVKTARILSEWIDGETTEALVERYRIGPGDLDSRIERAEWLLSAADALAETIDVAVPEVGRARSRL
ncbi:DEAD/DEAH box helicase [Halorubrum vacuolatum]|uniref:ATP-dependent DNA helicase Hel308 n=1 Tax=Halorubrum vacuolatum TaxID=63740 RepID=A0A238URL8_HALVU|nr:DEAD/DEAH box helicase [Halorubrum vacuolatum]SNR23979.1 helicase [Halorubrum vacuolatum]